MEKSEIWRELNRIMWQSQLPVEGKLERIKKLFDEEWEYTIEEVNRITKESAKEDIRKWKEDNKKRMLKRWKMYKELDNL